MEYKGIHFKPPSDRLHAACTHRAYTCIDLFAGCGGLSLGLERAGFRPLLFSEINPSAAETYIANRSDMDLLPVGDIHNLTDTDLALLKIYWRYKGIQDVDLVCGGPPCQGYSGIGHRRTFKLEKQEIHSNRLYLEMLRVIRAIRPKCFLFENVRGLLHGKWSATGRNGEIFSDILKSFRDIAGYKVHWQLLMAKEYGVPQNRPRIIIVGIRDDILMNHPAMQISCSRGYCDGLQAEGIAKGFIPAGGVDAPPLPELLGDLVDPQYLEVSATRAYKTPPLTFIQKELRTQRNGQVLSKGDPLTEQEYSNHSARIREKFQYMLDHQGEIPERFRTKKFAQRVMPWKWGPEGPNITVTSLPDDYVHFSQPRAPTVREWARLQTFPDWYMFCGPRTTGGRRRAGDPGLGDWSREVPKFTQIGNAVPVLLAAKIGSHLAELIRESGIASNHNIPVGAVAKDAAR